MLGAVTAYAVIVGGGLQLADIVVHALELPPWSLRVLIWIAALGLPLTFIVSWFWDLTRHGFVRTELSSDRRGPSVAPVDRERQAQAAAAVQSLGPGGTLAGRYRIERELGAGGMGRVLAAEDLRLGRKVAIKVVTLAHEPSRLRRFEQEARTASALEQPNVVAIYDLGDQDGIPFLVTELLEGHTLRTEIDQGPLPPAQAQGLALQLARGLCAAHAAGIVHRDLKPENLFLTRDGRLKILDFGMAKLLGPEEAKAGPGLTLTGVLFGSPGYISPEQARGEKPNAASDVFAAGAVLYELLCGMRAFPGGSLVEAGHAALTLQPPPLPDAVPQTLAAVIFRALEKDPRKRFQDGGELLRALEGVGEVAPAALTVRRRPRVSSVAMGVVAIGAIVAAVISALAVHPHAFVSAPPAETVAERAPAAQPPSAPEAPNLQVPAPPLPGGLVPNPRQVPKAPVRPGELEKSLGDLEQLGGMPREAEVGLVTGAHSMAKAGQLKSAIQLLEGLTQQNPGIASAQMELAALLRRDGQRAKANQVIQRSLRALTGDAWMAPLLRAWLGEGTDAQALAAAKVPGDAKASAARLGQAHYYLGLLHETASPPDLKTARKDYETAARTDGAPESRFATQALERLTPNEGD